MADSVWRTLSIAQIEYADGIGYGRAKYSYDRDLKHTNNKPANSLEDRLKNDIPGARAEMAAFAWLRPTHWERGPLTKPKKPDLAKFIDVKSVKSRNRRLIVQPGESPDFAFLLVCTAEHPDYEIRGWTWGREAKIQEYLEDVNRNGRPAFYVPNDKLRPPWALYDIVHPMEEP